MRSENRILKAARAGNQDAFSALVTRYQQRVYRLAVNITKNQEDARQEDPEQRCSSLECESRLREAVAALEPSRRLVLLLRDIEDYSNQEAAKLLGVSMTTVKTRLRRVRNDLKERLRGVVETERPGRQEQPN